MNKAIATRYDLANEIQAMKDAGVPMLGCIVYWTIPEGASFTKAQADLAIGELNMTPRMSPKDRNVRTAFHRATKEFSKHGSSDVEVKKIKEDAVHVVVAFVSTVCDESSRELSLENHLWVSVNKETGKLSVKDGHDTDAIYLSFRAMFQDAGIFLDTLDLRAMVKRGLPALSGFSMRPTGGVYFVPAAQSGQVDRLRDLVSRLHPRAMVYAAPIPATKTSQASFAANYKEAAETKFSEFRGRLANWINTVGNKRDETFKSKMKEIATMRTEAIMYESILDDAMVDVKSGLNALEKEVNALQKEPAKTVEEAPAQKVDDDDADDLDLDELLDEGIEV